jgi:hypothetical protein
MIPPNLFVPLAYTILSTLRGSRKEWNARLDTLRRTQTDLTVDQGRAALRSIDFMRKWMNKQGGFDQIAVNLPDAAFLEHFRAVWEIVDGGRGLALPALLELPGVLPRFREFFHVHPCAAGCGLKLYHSEPVSLQACEIGVGPLGSVLRCAKCAAKQDAQSRPCFHTHSCAHCGDRQVECSVLAVPLSCPSGLSLLCDQCKRRF